MRRGPIPAPFAAMNSSVPTCADPECGRPVHIDPPRGHTEFCAHTFVPAIIALFGMDRLPNEVDQFVVGARDTDGHRQIITIGDESADGRTAMIERAIEDLPSARMPGPITHLFITATKLEADGSAQCTSIASDECDKVEEPWSGRTLI